MTTAKLTIHTITERMGFKQRQQQSASTTLPTTLCIEVEVDGRTTKRTLVVDKDGNIKCGAVTL